MLTPERCGLDFGQVTNVPMNSVDSNFRTHVPPTILSGRRIAEILHIRFV